MNEMTTLANIERRISFHMQGAYSNILEVGRCLIEAKESGLVPHGQWEAWVNQTAGMSGRSAQRLMQAAREVRPDSAMAKLPISKIQAILALPEPQREEVAVKAVEENQSLRELQATIDAMRGDLEDARQKVQRVERERDDALTINNRIYKERAQIAHERDTAIEVRDRVKRELEEAKAAPATGISAEAQRQIDNFRGQARNAERRANELAAQLADAEKMAEYQAEQRQQAQQELLDLRTQVARGEGPGRDEGAGLGLSDADAIIEAVGAFMAGVGYAPYQLRLSAKERIDVKVRVKMIAEWASRMEDALNMVEKTVVIEGV